MTKPNKNMQEVLDHYAALDAPPLESVSPELARQLPTMTDAAHAAIGQHMKRLMTPFPEPVGKVSHRVIQGPASDLLLSIYTPEGTGPFPVLVYFHGGGWVIATLIKPLEAKRLRDFVDAISTPAVRAVVKNLNRCFYGHERSDH